MNKLKIFGILSVLTFSFTNTFAQATSPACVYNPQNPNAACNDALPDDYDSSDAGTYCPRLSTTLKRGMTDTQTNGQVSELQKFFIDYYDWTPTNLSAGVFDRTTQRVVIGFQKEQGLPSFGTVGQLTRNAIAKACGGEITTYPIYPINPVTNVSATITTDKSVYKTGDEITVKFQIQNNGNAAVKNLIIHNRCDDLNLRDASFKFYMNGVDYTSYFLNYNRLYNLFDNSSLTCSNTSEFLYPGQSVTLTFKNTIPSIIKEGVKNITIAFETNNSNSNDAYTVKAATTLTISNEINLNYPKITVTTPNGGEQWEEGVLNSITWAPYGYNPNINPSVDVDAYLETKNPDGSFTNLGSVIPSGKASIHWIGGFASDQYPNGQNERIVPPGNNYYIRVVNNRTGQTDRSDAPFTLLPKPIDLKINGSDGPVTINTYNQSVTVSWNISPKLNNCFFTGIRPNTSNINLSGSGSASVQPDLYGGSQGIIGIACNQTPLSTTLDPNPKAGGYFATNDTVSILLSGSTQPRASVQVITPNGGGFFDSSRPLYVTTAMSGVNKFSVALYKDDQWQAWIAKDQIPNLNLDGQPVTFIINDLIPNWGANGNPGQVWKIYVTAQKSDGTGYVDDKSDQPFSFDRTIFPTGPTCSLSASGSFGTVGQINGDNGTGVYIKAGEQVTLSWTSTNADVMFGLSTEDKWPANGSQVIVPAQTTKYNLLFKNSSTGISKNCSVIVNVTPTVPVPDKGWGSKVLGANVYCPKLTQNLERGATDSNSKGEVTELQKFLSQYFSINSENLVTGFYGDSTISYLSAFQAKNNLKASGFLGELTRNTIQNICK